MKIGIEIENLVFICSRAFDVCSSTLSGNGPKYWDNTDIVL